VQDEAEKVANRRQRKSRGEPEVWRRRTKF